MIKKYKILLVKRPIDCNLNQCKIKIIYPVLFRLEISNNFAGLNIKNVPRSRINIKSLS